MKWLTIAAAAMLLVAQGKTTQDGVYSDAQARRGGEIYDKACASCHVADLSGSGQAPALADAEFVKEWTGQPLSDLFDRIQTTMPGDAPGTLKPAETADVLAFILAKSHAPAGTTELVSDSTALKSIAFAARP